MSEPLHRVARIAASSFVYLTYRSVEVRRPEVDLSERPVIIAANHSAGFADPILIMHALERRPRFLAKATFWKRPMVGEFFDLFGVLPINRATDGATDGNIDTFAVCHEALRRREIIAVFPEGHINREPAIADIRTGTARIALGARAKGVSGIAIVPVGIHYERQTRLRGRIYARVGEPIDLDESIDRFVSPGDPQDDRNHEAVRSLTDEIEDRLRRVAPDFSSADEWALLGTAAEVFARSRLYDPTIEVSYGDREELASRLRHASPELRDRVLEATRSYEATLSCEGTNDIAVASSSLVGGALPDHVVRSAASAVALAPTASAGLVINALPLAAMTLLRRNLRVNPLVASTIRTVAAPIVYGGTWSVIGAALRRNHVRCGGSLAWALGVVGGWALVLASERIEDVRRGNAGLSGLPRTTRLDEIRAGRQAVLDAVEQATE